MKLNNSYCHNCGQLVLNDDELFACSRCNHTNKFVFNMEFKQIDDSLPSIRYATLGSAGIDLPACINDRTIETIISTSVLTTTINKDNDDGYMVIIPPGGRVRIPSGLKVTDMPEDIAGFVLSKSGNASKKGLIVLNAPGLIDSDFNMEIETILYNAGNESVIIKHGMEVSQLVFVSIIRPNHKNIAIPVPRVGGFGSTTKEGVCTVSTQ